MELPRRPLYYSELYRNIQMVVSVTCSKWLLAPNDFTCLVHPLVYQSVFSVFAVVKLSVAYIIIAWQFKSVRKKIHLLQLLKLRNIGDDIHVLVRELGSAGEVPFVVRGLFGGGGAELFQLLPFGTCAIIIIHLQLFPSNRAFWLVGKTCSKQHLLLAKTNPMIYFSQQQVLFSTSLITSRKAVYPIIALLCLNNRVLFIFQFNNMKI